MKIQHVSKTSFTIPGVGETDDHGVIDVSEDVAGRPPDARLDELMVQHRDAVAAGDHETARVLKEQIIGVDAGSGLLAQAAWSPFGSKAKAAVRQEGGES